MREVKEVFNVYTYSELSEEAKEKVKRWYLKDPLRSEDFYEIYMEDLHDFFPNSKLKMQFSLSSCQGDGLNIYGDLDLMDVFKAISSDKAYGGELIKDFWYVMTEHEQKTIEAYMKICGKNIKLPYNSHYCYCVADKTDFAEDWIEELEYQRYKNIQVDTIRKMEKLVADMFVMLSKTYEEYGYEYFYEVDEEEMTETCEANDWEFLEDGTFYAA